MEGGKCVEPERTTIAGGYHEVTTIQLVMAWYCRMRALITPLDFRVLFACFEAYHERLAAGRDGQWHFTVEEIRRLVGVIGCAKIRASLRRLERVGLLRFSASELVFATSPEELHLESLEELYELLGEIPYKRVVPVPRRILKFIAGGTAKVMTAVIVALMLCVLRRKRRAILATGNCKVGFICELFGVGERQVRSQIQRLEEMGWVIRICMPQWHQQYYGMHLRLNLDWGRPVSLKTIAQLSINSNEAQLSTTYSGKEAVCAPIAPSPPDIHMADCTPNKKNNLPSEDLKTKDPAFPRTAGFYASEGKDLTLEEKPSKEEQKVTVLKGAEKKSPDRTLPTPSLKSIREEDLTDTARLLLLCEEATKSGIIQEGEHDRLEFLGLAEHALTYGTKNRPGLFAWLLRERKFSFITQDDEDAARERLKRHHFGEEASKHRAGVFMGAQPVSEVVAGLVGEGRNRKPTATELYENSAAFQEERAWNERRNLLQRQVELLKAGFA